jgi:hypothetical protein
MLLLNNRAQNIGVMPEGQVTILTGVGYSLIDSTSTWYTVSNVGANVLTEVTDPTLINQLKLLIHTIHTDGTVRLYGSGLDWLGDAITGDDLENFLIGAKYIAKKNAANAYDKKYTALYSTESTLERSTWAQQLVEANAVQADSNAATPLLTILATSRNISVADYAQDVIAAANTYATAQADLVSGLKAAYQAIDATTTAQALKDTGWLI